MAKVLELITEALVSIKALAVGETPGADMTTDALVKFNDVLEALSLQNLAVYSTVETIVPLVAGVASYTIGPTGGVVAARPPFVDTAVVNITGLDYPLTSWSTEEYALIGLKSNPGIPSRMVYDQEFPNGRITLWPVPSDNWTMTLYTNAAFTAAASLFDEFNMPPGYRRLVRLLLAVELMPDYPGLGESENVALRQSAVGALAIVKRNTKKRGVLRSEVAQLDASGGSHWANWRDGS